MGRPRRYAVARDGTRIAWTSAGSGAPPVVLTDGIGCAGWIWGRLSPALARDRRVLHWNYRGHGASEAPRDPEKMTLQECSRDLVAVLDGAGVERAVLVGHSMGVQVVLDAWRRARGRVAGLVLVCGAPGRVLDTFHDSTALRSALPWARKLVDRWPDLARAGFRALVTADVALDYALAFEVNRALLHRDDLLPYFEDLSKVDPTLFVRLLASAAEHDATPWLPDIAVPTLVVAGARDAFTPMRLSVGMSQAIRGSDLLVLPGGTHVGPLEHPELLATRLRAFLAERVPVERPRTAARGRRKRATTSTAPPRPGPLPRGAGEREVLPSTATSTATATATATKRRPRARAARRSRP